MPLRGMVALTVLIVLLLDLAALLTLLAFDLGPDLDIFLLLFGGLDGLQGRRPALILV